MNDERQPTDAAEDESIEFGCWKWIFVGLGVLAAMVLAYLVVL